MNIHEIKSFLARVEHYILSEDKTERDSITFSDDERFGIGDEKFYTSQLAFTKNSDDKWVLRQPLTSPYKLTKEGHKIMSA